MTGITKDELMQMARNCAKQAGFDAFAKTLNAPQSLDAGDLVIKLTEHITNAILERAAVELECAWHTAEAADSIRALKINTGD